MATAGRWWPVVCLLTASAARAQVPDFVQLSPGARGAALGNATAGLLNYTEGRGANPAVLGALKKPTFRVGVSRTDVSDLDEARVGIGISMGYIGASAIDVRFRRVTDLIDDPDLAAESGLTVADWGASITHAIRVSPKVSFGAGAEKLSSIVFGTRGAGWSFSAGTGIRLSKRIAFGASLVRLGSDYKWRDEFNARSSSPLGRAALVGTSIQPFAGDRVATTILAEGEQGLDRRLYQQAFRLGSELTLGKIVFLRAGLECRREDHTMTRYPAGGIGLIFRGVQLDLARDRLGAEVGERTLIDMTLRY